jgi:two-component system chemotaxis response regulator CheY
MAFAILLVDDSPTILNLLSMTLSQAGYMVTTASDGVEALELAQVTQVDIVITDVNMPRMDGLTLITRLRELEHYRNIPIVVLSTQQSPLDHGQGKEAGADVYLDKPVSSGDLLGCIDKMLKR